ncbi:DEAD/DEAH box helicase [Veronia nyctiphanis]|uniref:DEAD-box ATP-dependent RNA helicase RhpA n=1 Tax=Veronia nyctiphanis TaxID=1278244 RepID=A0A4Q0YMT1_9GAMM|nr:DEAD/DEAH box helicase [Veronia nyctiphanis]RXJ71743.1 DEAD/DEAH box helicase [Veronia nyctiphanis]
MPFSKLGLRKPITQAVSELGYNSPTPIQEKAIPAVLAGKNILAAAQTGTGKTASFVLPILEQLSDGKTIRKKRVRALILTPTRELALQVQENIDLYAKHLPLTSLAMYGGTRIDAQKQKLIDGVDILVATPGRLLDMMFQRAVHFDELETLVLDEADRMLDMGFIDDINKIIERLPSERQNLLFSATLSKQVRFLAKTAIDNPIEISVTEEKSAEPKIEQWLTTVDKDKKSALLSQMINDNYWKQALIFIETKHGAAKLVTQLEKRGIHAESFHSGRSQAVREQLLEDFKQEKVKFIVATGIAARGIDIENLVRVVNYDLPFQPDDYVHRIGRTGRAGAEGEAISFVSKDDFKNLCKIESRLGYIIERRDIEGFAPRKAVPISILNYVPKNKKTANTKRKDSKKDTKRHADKENLDNRKPKLASKGNNRNTPAENTTPNDNNPWHSLKPKN